MNETPPPAVTQPPTVSNEPTLAQPPAAVAPVGWVGKQFGEYQIVREIARGGMGVVYEARQRGPNRPVAVKMILAGQLASGEDVKRFYAEAEAAGKLDHPNIVPIYEAGEREGQHFFSMKMIDGGSLAQHRERYRDPKAAAALMATVARAVQHAHDQGILHRDLKPANILLDEHGQPHVSDFGLAKRIATADAPTVTPQHLTRTGAVMGTPNYMPPEQAVGKRELTSAADVYSLGAILYELLTGGPPFRAETALDTIMEVMHREPTPPRQIKADIPRELETICLQCLAKDPAQRFASPKELAEDLDRYLAAEPIQARRAGPLTRAFRWVRKNPAWVGVGALALAALAITLYALWPDGSLRHVQRAGKLVVAVDPTYPPMEYRDKDGELVGFDIDMGRELARRLGVEAEFVPVGWNWGDLTGRLKKREFDVLLSSIAHTPERERDVEFVDYFFPRFAMVCRKDDRLALAEEEQQLEGKTVAVQVDTPVQLWIGGLRSKGLAMPEPKTFPTAPDCFAAVARGEADVAFDKEPVARFYARADGRLQVKVPEWRVMDPEPIGVALRKGDRSLRKAIEDALKAIRQDATAYNKMTRKHFGTVMAPGK